MDLIKLGSPLQAGLTANNHLLFRVDKPKEPVIGLPVVDTSMQKVGKVFDLFGPVEKPFLSVSLDKAKLEDASALAASTYFILKERRKGASRKGKNFRKRP